MRNPSFGILALGLALSLSNGKASSVEVGVEVGVGVGGGAVSIGYFHDQLSSHGSWIDVETYGRVWQPTVVVTDENWRPYVNDGHWRYTDQGWYWDSSYAWGWAPFHYGRWNYHERHRWIWQPDTVWAPAWVDWRRSDSYYGWAPLPFGSRFEGGIFVGVNFGNLHEDRYSFVPSGSFLSVNLGTVVLPRSRSGAIYRQTIVVKNNYTYNDNRVINNGIPVAEVAKVTKQEIKAEAIADAKSPTEKGSDKGKVAAFRPKFKKDDAKDAATDAKTGEAEGEKPVPAAHVTKESGTDPKAKNSESKTDTEPRDPRKVPDSNEPEKAPEAREPREPRKAPDAKESEKTPEAREPRRGPDAQEPRKDPDVQDPRRAPDTQEPRKSTDAQGPRRAPDTQDPRKAPNAPPRQAPSSNDHDQGREGKTGEKQEKTNRGDGRGH